MRKICILTGVHLCHNPRVIKEASTLAAAGFDVTVLGGITDPKLKQRDQDLQADALYRFVPVVDVTAPPRRKTISKIRIGKLLHRTLRVENRWQMGEAYSSLQRMALNTPADLYICHMEQALAVGDRLLRDGRRVAVDMEDWYSHDLPKRVRRHRPVRLLQKLERRLLTKGAFGLCTSHAMAERLAVVYQCPPPVVIYNTFPWVDREALAAKPPKYQAPSIYWFSQTLGPGRGLEDLVSALPRINFPVEIHLRGAPSVGFEEWLKARIPHRWADKIFFHAPVHNTQLLACIAEHQIGFAGEQIDSSNKDLTVSNKIFHYMLGGLAILASNTKGQQEIAANANGGIRLYRAGNPASLAEQLNSLLASPAKLEASMAASLTAAHKTYCWERQEAKLVELVEESLRARAR